MHVDYLFYCNSYMKTIIGLTLHVIIISLSLHKSTVVSGFVYRNIEHLKACICNLTSAGLITIYNSLQTRHNCYLSLHLIIICNKCTCNNFPLGKNHCIFM